MLGLRERPSLAGLRPRARREERRVFFLFFLEFSKPFSKGVLNQFKFG
jgi:hypothetical protein